MVVCGGGFGFDLAEKKVVVLCSIWSHSGEVSAEK